MVERNLGIHDGNVYKKIPRSKYTYIFCSGVEDFLLNLLSNMTLADVIAPLLGQLTNIMSKKQSKIIQPIKIDYNYIEVLPEGVCFNIAKKQFVKDPEDLNGSPRAFVLYNYKENVIPYPSSLLKVTFSLILNGF